ncbi:unnamed protein product, partial [Amoebophrya sp. A120]|eukprot:GSA120T00013565001.1
MTSFIFFTQAAGRSCWRLWRSQTLHSHLLHDLSCKININIHRVKRLRMTTSRRAKQHLNLCGICNARAAIVPLAILALQI